MSKVGSKIISHSWLTILVSISIAACTDKSTKSPFEASQPPPVVDSSAPKIATPSSEPPAQRNQGDIYEQAITKADAANAIGQSALSKDDWFLVVSNLEASVQMLKSIAPTSAEYILAAKVLPKYEQQLATAKQKVVNFVSKPVQRAVIPEPITATPIATVPEDPNTFAIPIEKKLGGVPVIKVTFNQKDRVSMLLDTGASRTLITRSIAERLQLATHGISQAKTANGTATFKVAKIDQIKFGNAEKQAVEVAIGQNDLPYGLLGHDVYNGYDITIKESSIEFRKR